MGSTLVSPGRSSPRSARGRGGRPTSCGAGGPRGPHDARAGSADAQRAPLPRGDGGAARGDHRRIAQHAAAHRAAARAALRGQPAHAPPGAGPPGAERSRVTPAGAGDHGEPGEGPPPARAALHPGGGSPPAGAHPRDAGAALRDEHRAPRVGARGAPAPAAEPSGRRRAAPAGRRPGDRPRPRLGADGAGRALPTRGGGGPAAGSAARPGPRAAGPARLGDRDPSERPRGGAGARHHLRRPGGGQPGHRLLAPGRAGIPKRAMLPHRPREVPRGGAGPPAGREAGAAGAIPAPLKHGEGAMTERRLPTEAEVRSWIRDRSNWGRWGPDDQRGTINLITPAKRVAAARLCRTGRSVSLSRPFPKEPGINNAIPAQHFMRTMPRGRGGAAMDFYGIFYHGVASTHIDALCHTWDEHAMWNGRDPKREITFDGATFGSVEHLREGIITRGVLLDVPRHRGIASVTHDRPVHGWELEEILEARKIRLEPGDAVAVYSGREAWQAANPDTPYGRPFGPPL